jgi:hypothetical protein
MASEIKSDKLSPSTGTSLQIGDASDTITIPTGATFTITDGLGVAGGGTGLTSLTAGDVLYATGTTTLAKLAKGTAEQVLAMNSGATAPDWGSVDLTVLPTITAVKGGTGQTGFTAGDIFYANSTTTIAKLGVGSGSDTLKMNSGATAPEWVTVAASGGKVGQIVNAGKADVYSQTANSWTDITDITVDITPAATTSKVLVLASLCTSKTSGGGNGYFRLVRDSTVIGVGTGGSAYNGFGMTDQSEDSGTTSLKSVQYLDSPATTSATTYKCQCNNVDTSKASYLNRRAGGTGFGGFSSITAIELLA